MLIRFGRCMLFCAGLLLNANALAATADLILEPAGAIEVVQSPDDTAQKTFTLTATKNQKLGFLDGPTVTLERFEGANINDCVRFKTGTGQAIKTADLPIQVFRTGALSATGANTFQLLSTKPAAGLYCGKVTFAFKPEDQTSAAMVFEARLAVLSQSVLQVQLAEGTKLEANLVRCGTRSPITVNVNPWKFEPKGLPECFLNFLVPGGQMTETPVVRLPLRELNNRDFCVEGVQPFLKNDSAKVWLSKSFQIIDGIDPQHPSICSTHGQLELGVRYKLFEGQVPSGSYVGKLNVILQGASAPVAIVTEVNVRSTPTVVVSLLLFGVLLGQLLVSSDSIAKSSRLVAVMTLRKQLQVTRLATWLPPDATRTSFHAVLNAVEKLIKENKLSEADALLCDFKTRLSLLPSDKSIVEDPLIQNLYKKILDETSGAWTHQLDTLCTDASWNAISVAQQPPKRTWPNLTWALPFLWALVGVDPQDPSAVQSLRGFIWVVSLLVLTAYGFNQQYVSNPTFGANIIGDILAVLLWGTGSQVVSKRLRDLADGLGKTT